ncbi:hypothetical protein F4806DRAFT_199553 [Annulohypoxylon nitens]|nr:hypothetical protein F4806DRAFT_199553 [Annulohypoxylon nitens]
MILTRAGMAINPGSQDARPSLIPPLAPPSSSPPPPPAAAAVSAIFDTAADTVAETLSTSDLQTPTYHERGKQKAISRKPWADEPWPLIEPLSRTLRITHPAHHIANEISHTHNAMLRGLNTIYLQAPFVRNPVDIADFLFLVRAWSGWVLDYHELKESTMIPGFETTLGVNKGVLRAMEDSFNTRSREIEEEGDGTSGDKPEEEEIGERDKDTDTGARLSQLPTLLRNLRSYAIETHPQPSSYSPSTLHTLLASLASVLVPHLHNQIGMFLCMEQLSAPPSNSSVTSLQSIPSLPSLSASPAPSNPSTLTSISTPPSTTPSTQSKSPAPSPKATLLSSPSPHSPSPVPSPRPRHKPKPSPRAASLTQIHLSTESTFTQRADRYTVPPMQIRLRDVSYDGASKLTVPAIHAIADRLSPKYAGSWRFLPCDIWGRRRGLGFIGEGE